MVAFPVLLGDIGGTNARFAVLPGPGEPMRGLPKQSTKDFGDPLEAARAALGSDAGALKGGSALLAVATRVDSLKAHLTNAPWTVDAEAIGEGLALSSVTLMNDYVPVAASLASLADNGHDLMRIGAKAGRRPTEKGARFVLGPGTGLGGAALITAGPCRLVQPTEVGHIEFGPTHEMEMRLWPLIERSWGRITAEAVLSGPGLVRLYRALSALEGKPATLQTPREISDAALTGKDPLAADAAQLFLRCLARLAGDLALLFMATGGIFIAGGIVPRLTSILPAGAFRQSFEGKAPLEYLARSVPTFIVTHPEPALEGLAQLAANPQSFLFESQTWSQ